MHCLISHDAWLKRHTVRLLNQNSIEDHTYCTICKKFGDGRMFWGDGMTTLGDSCLVHYKYTKRLANNQLYRDLHLKITITINDFKLWKKNPFTTVVSFDRCTLKTKENSDSRLWSLWNMLLVPIKVSWFRNVADCSTYSNYEKRIITKSLPSGAFFTRMAGLNVSDLSNLQRKIHILQDALINFNMVWNRAWNNDLFLHAKN